MILLIFLSFSFCTSVFNPNAEALSQCGDNLDWKEKLYWLQPRRDVGLWIECCRKKCKKWRYVESYHDPVDVPKIWYCEMNSGLYTVCFVIFCVFHTCLISLRD